MPIPSSDAERERDKTDKTTVYFLRPPAPGKGRTLYIIISSIHISRMVKTNNLIQ